MTLINKFMFTFSHLLLLSENLKPQIKKKKTMYIFKFPRFISASCAPQGFPKLDSLHQISNFARSIPPKPNFSKLNVKRISNTRNE